MTVSVRSSQEGGGGNMAFTPVERMQIKNAVERALHVPGNYTGGILEMAMVFDCSLSTECVERIGKDIAALLKSHSEVFRNVRLNVIFWDGDGDMVKSVSSLPKLQMGGWLEGYCHVACRKRVELLAGQLKKFYARSKIILLFTDGNCQVEDEDLYQENMHPFLYRKLAVLRLCAEGQNEERRWATKVHMGMEKGWMTE